MQIRKVKTADPLGVLPKDIVSYQVFFSSDDPLRPFHGWVMSGRKPKTHAQIREDLMELAKTGAAEKDATCHVVAENAEATADELLKTMTFPEYWSVLAMGGFVDSLGGAEYRRYLKERGLREDEAQDMTAAEVLQASA
jgi:hypothetical protein